MISLMKKTIKQYVYFSDINKSEIIELNRLAFNYTNAKNYFYSRYSGINSYYSLFNYRSEIRDVLVKNKDNINFNLPPRYWKLALDETISNIKSNWSNTINNIKKSINSNTNLNEHEKHYIYYILKSKQLFYNILNNNKFEIPSKISYDIDYSKLNKLIRRLTRKYKSNISYSYKKNNFIVDNSMFKYDNEYLFIQGLVTGKRLKLKVNNNLRFNKQIRIVIEYNRLVIHSQIDVKIKSLNLTENIIGVDKNYENVISTSNDNIYGDEINKLFNKHTDLVTEKQKKRNKICEVIKNLKTKNIDDPKINKIKRNNLGNKKNNNQKQKIKENIKSIINNSLNDFIEIEKPTEIICEDLKFNSRNKKLNKKTKHKLNSWSKGYLRDRIEYKGYQNNIKIVEVNAAFTSQTCSYCGYYQGKRSDTNMFYCSNCNKGLNVHLNSARVILQRKYDLEIKLKQSPRNIINILLTRNKRLLELKTEPTKTQEIQIIFNDLNQSESEISINI